MSSERPRTTHDLVGERESSDQSASDADSNERGTLIPDWRASDYQARWDEVQSDFVEDPRRAVRQADGLVQDVMRDISDTFTRERESLEHNWARGESVDTEELRTALQRYRAFFERLLST